MSLLPRSRKPFAFRSPSGRGRGPTLPGSCGCRDCRIRRCAPPKAASRTLARPISQSHWVTLWRWRHARSRCGSAIWPAAEHYGEMLLDHSTRHALARWHVLGRCHQGVLAIQRGDLSIGLRLLRAGLDEPGAAGSAPRFFTFLMAEALGRAGQIAEGLVAIEEAIVRSERNEERWATAELLRIKGELVLLQGAPGAAAAAEGHFRQALDWARRQGALSWELRTASSLARLWRDQD